MVATASRQTEQLASQLAGRSSQAKAVAAPGLGRGFDEYDGLPMASMFGPIHAHARTLAREAAERVARGIERC
jgi:hypothetical protein